MKKITILISIVLALTLILCYYTYSESIVNLGKEGGIYHGKRYKSAVFKFEIGKRLGENINDQDLYSVKNDSIITDKNITDFLASGAIDICPASYK